MQHPLISQSVIIFLCFWSGWQAALGEHAVPGQGGNSSASDSLTLTTRVVEQIYCTDGDVRLLLELKYVNLGTESIILNRNSFGIARLTVSRTEKAAAKHRYEKVANYLYSDFVQPKPTRGLQPPSDRFIVLAPGQSYELSTKEIFHDPAVNNYVDLSDLSEGKHFLQISVRTWEEDVSLAKELSVAWRKYGFLRWNGVTSQPMALNIKKPTSTVPCR